MPQADFYYSQDLTIDVPAVFATIERIISAQDSQAGACKGRAFAVAQTHHRHALLRLALLDKPHRDDAFMRALQTELSTAISAQLPSPCTLGVELRFLSPHYVSVTV